MRARRRTVVIVIVLLLVVALIAGMLYQRYRHPRLYRATVLPLWLGTELDPHAVNDRGQVVGLISGTGGGSHLFLWDREKGVQDLGAVRGKRCDINNDGWIVGTMTGPNGLDQAFRRDPNGAVEFLGDFGGPSTADAINNLGQVVGHAVEIAARDAMQAFHAYLWDPEDGMRRLPHCGGRITWATDISDTGKILGYTHVPGLGPPSLRRHPHYWSPDDPFNDEGTPTPGRDYFGMSDQGWVVGRHFFARSGPYVVAWQDFAGLEKLFPYSLEERVLEQPVMMINDANQVVYSEEHHSRWEDYSAKLFAPRQRWRLWDRTRGKVPLDPYLPRRTQRFELRDLNNHGCILGVAHLKDKRTHLAVLLEPITERWEQ